MDYTGNPDYQKIPEAGQFFTLLPISHPLQQMRRPFAYSDADAVGFSFVYEIRGEVSSDISRLSEGAVLDWIGPLGSSFPAPSGGRRPVLVAGGIGVGPVYYLARRLAEKGFRSLIILGARNSALVPELAWPSEAEIRICTDDGSRGFRGTAVDALNNSVSGGADFYTCGPLPMMKGVHEAALRTGSPCWVSMEEMMACGVGACQGCAVEMAERSPDGGPTYKRACVEGPIFDSRELAW